MSRLTDRKSGFVADRIRRRIEGTAARRMVDAEVRLDRIEHLLAYQLRTFQGIRIDTKGVDIRPDARGWLAFSTDANLAINRNPNKRTDHAKWAMSATPGCTGSIPTNIDCNADQLTATQCGATLTHQTGNGYVTAHLTGTANAQVLSYEWCAPSGAGIEPIISGFQFPAPDVWITIPVGDECTGGCVSYVVPGWTPTPPP